MRFLPYLTILFASAALAQDAEVPAIPAPAPAAEVPLVEPPIVAPPAALPPGALPPGVNPEANVEPINLANLGDTLINESIDQPKLSGADLAALYRNYTGHRIIVSSAAAQAEFSFVQPASPEDPLTYSQAAELLKKAATIENFIFVPDGADPTLEYLTLPTAGIKPSNIGLRVYNDGDLLPEGDAVIIYNMRLKHLKPQEAEGVFQRIIGQLGAFGSITTSGSSVIITENTSLIRRLIELKDEIDKPASTVETRFITVQYADVTELATTLNEILGTQQNSSNTAAVQRAQPQADQTINRNNIDAVPNGVDTGGSASGEASPIQIVPVPRTNHIFAMGREVDLDFVEGLVSQFDTKTDQRNLLKRKLKFLAVADFLPIAGDALTRAFSGTGDQSGASAQGNNNNNNRRQQTNNTNNSNLANGNNQQNAGGVGGSSGTRGNSLSDPQVNSGPESLLIGRTLLIADNISNAIVVQGPPSSVEIIENLLDHLDVKADQVMISTVFGQLSLGDNISTGVDWIKAFRGNGNGGAAGSSIGGGVNNGLDPSGFFTPAGGSSSNAASIVNGLLPGQTGLSLYGKIGNSLSAYVKLLSTSSDFTILSRPSIFTANNRKGTISSGRRIAVPTNSNQFSGGGVSTNIEYRDVVLKLEVIPLVNSENEITLQIALVSDDIIGSTNITGLGEVPTIGTRELLTTVTVPNNQTIILGGLITTNDTETITGIPILSDIPGLGRLFSSKSNGVNRDELMIFIQPSIVNSDRSLDYVQADMDERYNVSGPARTFADGSVLPPLEPMMEKGGSTIPAAVPVEGEEQNFNRKSIRPIHRR